MSLQYDKYIKYVKYDINTKYINNEKYNNHSDNFQYFLQWMCSTGRKGNGTSSDRVISTYTFHDRNYPFSLFPFPFIILP